MAVRTDNGKISENPGPLVLPSECKDAKTCHASFAKVSVGCGLGWGRVGMFGGGMVW